jgi:hypothetical protein
MVPYFESHTLCGITFFDWVPQHSRKLAGVRRTTNLVQFHPLPRTGRSQHVQSLVAHDLAVLTAAFEWFKRFKDWRENLQDDSRRGHPLTSRNADAIENVHEIMT